MSKKALTELTDEELNKLLDNTIESNTISGINDINEFISTYNIKSGSFRIPTKLLYKIYKSWSKDPLRGKTFTNNLTDLFPVIRYGSGFMLCLNKDVWNLKEDFNKHFKPLNKTKNKNYKEHFDNFLKHYNIENGSFFIKDSVLYNLYDKWTYKNKKRHPLGEAQFINFCRLYFPKFKKIEKVYWFPIDHSINQYLSEELKRQMKETDETKNKKITG